MSRSLIEIENLGFAYNKNFVIENASLKVERGNFVGIFGPNGGGKTTLLNLLMGFAKPTYGKVFLFGKAPKNTRHKVGYVPQIARFDKQFPISVFELVLTGAISACSWWGGYPKNIKSKAEKALERVGLQDLKNRAFGTLSGGQAQRALIARALVSDPELLLLDEPTASVDARSEEEIHALLLELKGSMTILMVTHDLQAIVDKADTLLCVRKTIYPLLPKDACSHYALGLYHAPLINPS